MVCCSFMTGISTLIYEEAIFNDPDVGRNEWRRKLGETPSALRLSRFIKGVSDFPKFHHPQVSHVIKFKRQIIYIACIIYRVCMYYKMMTMVFACLTLSVGCSLVCYWDNLVWFVWLGGWRNVKRRRSVKDFQLCMRDEWLCRARETGKEGDQTDLPTTHIYIWLGPPKTWSLYRQLC